MSAAATLVSIVTPSYQQAGFLEETIRSVLEQDHPAIEYVVVDGGSTDGSVEIVRRYADRLAWWVSEPDRGQTHAIRKGWERARGSVLAYLNADDVLLPGAVSRAVAALAADPGAVMAYGHCDLLDEATGRTRPMDAGPVGLAALLARRALIPQPATFVRADAVRDVGGPDERLRYAMDFDLWLRLLLRGPAAFVEGPPLARYRAHPATKSSRAAEAFAVELRAILDRFYALEGLPIEAIRVRRRAYAEADLVGARGALSQTRIAATVSWLLHAAADDPAALVAAASRRLSPVRGERP